VYGFAIGDPINFADPFGNRACFQGSAADRFELQHHTEVATGTKFNVVQQNDGAHCAENVQTVGQSTRRSRGFTEIAQATNYTLWIAKVLGVGSAVRGTRLEYDPTSLTNSYLVGAGGQCVQGPSYQAGQIVAHELGHFYAMATVPLFTHQYAEAWEHEWSLANGQPLRPFWYSHGFGCNQHPTIP